MFFSLDTQWLRHAMSGQRLGLDYAKIEPVARLLAVSADTALFMDLRRMEAAALEEFARP